jgi:glycosyltransferase involved in cell wall biosynthesis
VRIAFYAPMKAPTHPLPSGERQMARLLWAALEKAGHDVELASSFRSYDGSGCATRQRRLAMIGARVAERTLRRYRQRPATKRPEIWLTYHLYHKAPDWLGPRVCHTLAIPYVVAEASSAPKQASGLWAAGHKAANEAITAAALIIILNRADRPCLAPLTGDTRRLVTLLPFVDADRFFRAAANRERHRRALTQRLALDADEPVLLAVAMMRPGDKSNSYRVLGRALSQITDRRWTLVVGGDGPARSDVEQALAAIGGRVRWLGLIDEPTLPAVYAAADLYVWPAVNEAYGLAFLEAQAAGLAVVAGRCGGVPDVVGDGETGCLVPVGDAAAYACAVARLLDDPGLYRAMGRRALSRIATRHDLAPASAALAGFLDTLVRVRNMA